ncbi:MAG: CPBP family intramembrane glutamic endopeptidase [Bdellovibrionota bacterium]
MKLFVLIVLSTLPFAASLLYFLPSEPHPLFMYLLGATKIFLFLSPILFWKHLKLPGSWKNFLSEVNCSAPKRQILLGVLIGFIMSVPVLILFEWLPLDIRSEALLRISKKISLLNIKEHYFLYGIFLCLIHSLLEEFYWRFFIFNAWKKVKFSSKAIPHLIAGFAFTLHHFSVTINYFDLKLGLLLGLGVWIAGIIWSFTYEKEKSLQAVWVSHILIDIAILSIGFKAL